RVEVLMQDLRQYAEGLTPLEEPDSIFRIGVAGSEESAPRAQRAINIAEKPRVGLRTPEDAAALEEPGELPEPFKIQGQRSEVGQFQRSVDMHGRVEQSGREFAGRPLDVGMDYEAALKPEALTEDASRLRKPIRIGKDVAASEE